MIAITPDIGREPRKMKTFTVYQNKQTGNWGFEGPGIHMCTYKSEPAARQGVRDFCLDHGIKEYQVLVK